VLHDDLHGLPFALYWLACLLLLALAVLTALLDFMILRRESVRQQLSLLQDTLVSSRRQPPSTTASDAAPTTTNRHQPKPPDATAPRVTGPDAADAGKRLIPSTDRDISQKATRP
jgi:hypothetical protein